MMLCQTQATVMTISQGQCQVLVQRNQAIWSCKRENLFAYKRFNKLIILILGLTLKGIYRNKLPKVTF